MEERGVGGIDEREAVDAMMAAVGEDEGGPFAELGLSGEQRWLEGVEGREGVVSREGEACGG